MIFILQFVYVVYPTLIGLWILNNLCIPGINSILSSYVVLVMYCWVLFASILLRVFVYMFLSDTGLILVSR